MVVELVLLYFLCEFSIYLLWCFIFAVQFYVSEWPCWYFFSSHGVVINNAVAAIVELLEFAEAVGKDGSGVDYVGIVGDAEVLNDVDVAARVIIEFFWEERDGHGFHFLEFFWFEFVYGTVEHEYFVSLLAFKI